MQNYEEHASEGMLNQAINLLEDDAVAFFGKLRYVADSCEVDADELLDTLKQYS